MKSTSKEHFYRSLIQTRENEKKLKTELECTDTKSFKAAIKSKMKRDEEILLLKGTLFRLRQDGILNSLGQNDESLDETPDPPTRRHTVTIAAADKLDSKTEAKMRSDRDKFACDYRCKITAADPTRQKLLELGGGTSTSQAAEREEKLQMRRERLASVATAADPGQEHRKPSLLEKPAEDGRMRSGSITSESSAGLSRPRRSCVPKIGLLEKFERKEEKTAKAAVDKIKNILKAYVEIRRNLAVEYKEDFEKTMLQASKQEEATTSYQEEERRQAHIRWIKSKVMSEVDEMSQTCPLHIYPDVKQGTTEGSKPADASSVQPEVPDEKDLSKKNQKETDKKKDRSRTKKRSGTSDNDPDCEFDEFDAPDMIKYVFVLKRKDGSPTNEQETRNTSKQFIGRDL